MWHPSLAIHQAAWGEVTGRTASPPPAGRPAGRRAAALRRLCRCPSIYELAIKTVCKCRYLPTYPRHVARIAAQGGGGGARL